MRKEGGISVRQQIAMVKAYKASVEQPGKVSVPKKFRKEKADKPEQEEYVEVEYEEMKPPLVFVDGYNVIGYLRATGDNPAMRDFSEARDVLISDLAVLAGTTGWLIEVVFDAYKVKMPQKTEDYDGIRITYTSATETADSYIERRFFELHKEGFKNMLLCSDDILLRTVASEGLGYMPVSLLAEEIRIAYLQWEYFEQQMIAQSKRASDNFRIFPEELVNELKALMIEGQKRRALEAEAAAALVAANNATMATNGTIAGHVEGSNSSSLAVNITDSGNKTTTFIGKKGKERKKYITLPFYNQKITPAEAKLAKNIVVFEGLL